MFEHLFSLCSGIYVKYTNFALYFVKMDGIYCCIKHTSFDLNNKNDIRDCVIVFIADATGIAAAVADAAKQTIKRVKLYFAIEA